MGRYGVATVFADDWGEALRMAMVEMWRHRAIAHGEMQTLNLKLPPEIASAIRPPVELICPRCPFRIVVFRHVIRPSPETEKGSTTDKEIPPTVLDAFMDEIDQPGSSSPTARRS